MLIKKNVYQKITKTLYSFVVKMHCFSLLATIIFFHQGSYQSIQMSSSNYNALCQILSLPLSVVINGLKIKGQGHLKVFWRIKSSDSQDINYCIFFIFPDEQLLEGKNMSD